MILQTFLPAINPIVAPELSDDGRLRFTNAAVEADVASGPAAYVSSWYAYDNRSDSNTPLGHVRGGQPLLAAPTALPSDGGAFVHIEVSAIDQRRIEWSSPVHLFFRREASGWRLVGLDREIDRE